MEVKINLQALDMKSFNPILSTGDEESDGELGVITRKKLKRPPRYKVLLHNDDYTTMEFVIYVLEKIFGKNQEEAYAIMLLVHNEGRGVCGIFSYEVAESKMKKVSLEAKQNGHPLLCTMEPE
ncbi:ATP-dependent Clp protease adapter ClpS [Bacteriovorax sp. Seq25_V]|uniref:ATP-dependent Clp protease adapter ClpS n=1 Tax=Bacteriovorax sp. Seq25_V TaxID=1201288 RepID=UPI00038A1DEB|nr:ATP-dependent Clp protease adapter ClpS [Bacteriovorax sp. Seq25_V]EQC47984.1 ATP-dependent Clp protease adaptor protein ClpS [Bacteriovorax sp. Seq25_V]